MSMSAKLQAALHKISQIYVWLQDQPSIVFSERRGQKEKGWNVSIF